MSKHHISKREINLLIMGQTGVGKSTFINALVNVMTFDSLTAAEIHKKTVSLIGSSFTITDSNFKKVVIRTENEDNEDFSVGRSSTQTSRVYCFETDFLVMRIIDTPGIGDTRGIDQDKENFENILATISNLDRIHGILVLLKPNDSIIGVMFRFCVSELLMQLHKSAAANIIFGFTHGRASFYRPGETYPALEELLNSSELTTKVPLTKGNVFCFDSESYRFLAAVKQGVKFDPETRADFEKSWDQFTTVVNRMVRYVMSLEPHMVKKTTTINEARQTIIRLIKPLGELTRLIDVNIKVVEDKIEELNSTTAKGLELNSRLIVKKIDLQPKALTHPRTVCTHSDCVEVSDCPGGRQVINYITHCHPHCYLTGVTADTINNPALIRCAAMNCTNFCKLCSHGYEVHMHIYYEMKEVVKKVPVAGIKNLIRKNADDVDKIETAIDLLNNWNKEYQEEKKVVEHAAAEFGCFLKHNAILPTSDARIEYLDYLIREEKAKSRFSADDSMVQSLMETKQMYQKEFDIIDKAIGRGSNLEVLDPGHVAEVEEQLMQLKHFGKTLQRVKAAKAQAFAKHYQERKYIAPSASSFIQRLRETQIQFGQK